MSYFGSVKFYKHLILLIVLLIIVFPYLFSIYLTLENNELQGQVYKAIANMNSTAQDNAYSTTQDKMSMDVSNTLDVNQTTNGSNEQVVRLSYKTPSYHQKYKDLYVERKTISNIDNDDKVAYLTFDDGPSEVTLEILDILDNYNIKATFFVVYKDDDLSLEIYKDIVNRGHTLAIHSASHIYKEIYKSVDDYLDDFYKIFMHIYEVTGVKPDIFRFPGGSINTYNFDFYQDIVAEMLRRGFVYHDWNVSSGDATNGSTKESIVKTVSNGLRDYNEVVVLMHDSITKNDTAHSLPEIIKNLQDNGFRFSKLDGTVSPIVFSYPE